MIPDIGLMIAAYIVTRMVWIVVKRDPREHVVVIVMAVATIIVAAIGAVDLVVRGGGNLSTSSALQPSAPIGGT
jgi:hypothetical protein